MKNVSNEFKNIIKSGGPFYAYASITLKNGEKLYLDSENDFFISGNGYSEDGGDGFPLGSALSKSVVLVIDNIDERYSKYDFYYAQISLFTEADIENRSYDIWRDIKGEEILDINGNTIMLTKSRIERLNEGTFTVLEPTAVGDTIELVGYDSMYKADADFTSKLSYPTTAGQLLREACSTCNIMLGSPKFNNDDFAIEQAPDKVTCREVIGYIAMLAVGNAVIQDGTLVIKSYDFSAISKIASRADLVEDAGYSILMDYQSDPDISTDPVVITGIATTKKVENESRILIRGTDDYALEITNPLIEGHEDDAINLIGDVLIGVKLRGFSGEFFPDPTIEFMDLACVVDRKDKVYPTFITSLEFNYLGSSSFSCGIKDPERQKSTYYSEATKVYEKAKKEIKQNKTDFEAAVENLNKTLENASGMYSTESPQPDGSMITYIHDKPTVEESKNVIKVTSEAIGISNDGGKTYPYGLFLTGDLITRILYAIGINADYINSGSLTVKDKNGNITFYADTETGRVTINAESISITGKSVEDISNGIVDDFVTNIYKNDIDEIKESVRNKIETWYQDSDPSVNWKDKTEHEGDLWKDTRDNKEYIYRSGQWVEMNVPNEVFDGIDGKSSIYVTQPNPPYNVGDAWFTGTDILTCVVDRDSGEFVVSDWQKKDNYTDDSTVTDFIENIYDPKIEDIQNQIDGKIDTYYYDYEPANSNHPASEWTTAYERQKHVGDLFFWKNKGFTYRYMKVDTSYQWVRVKDADIVSAMETASKAQDAADGKRRNFITTPVPPYDVGDLWTQGDTGDLMRCKTARASGNYVSSDWTKATKYTDDSAVEKLNKSLTSEEVFNRLTDNGKKQGIYMQGDQLYINFSYGKGGTLTLGGVNNENGSIQILDAIGAEVGKWDKDGLNIKKGSIYGSTIYLDKEKAYALIVGRNNSKEIFTIGSMGMHIDNTNMGLLASDSMVVDLMGGWFHGLRMKASNNGRGYGSSISPECFSIGWAEDLQGWSDAMSTVKSYTFSISENSTGCLSIRINGSNYINDYVDISPREIKTTGTKNRVVPTENYSNRLQYCYETASPMFGDIGEGITDENGECIVEIGDIFTETVTTRIEYQVFLQKEGKGDLWIEKKEENYFIVHGTPNLKFAWELKAKQKDYEYVNLEEDVDREEKLPESPENILNAELESLIKEQEELLNETA